MSRSWVGMLPDFLPSTMFTILRLNMWDAKREINKCGRSTRCTPRWTPKVYYTSIAESGRKKIRPLSSYFRQLSSSTTVWLSWRNQRNQVLGNGLSANWVRIFPLFFFIFLLFLMLFSSGARWRCWRTSKNHQIWKKYSEKNPHSSCAQLIFQVNSRYISRYPKIKQVNYRPAHECLFNFFSRPDTTSALM